MLRRDFLIGGASAIGVALAGMPALAGAAEPGRLLRYDTLLRVWREFDGAVASRGLRRLRLLGPRIATGSDLDRLQLDLLFDRGGEHAARFLGWHFQAGAAGGNSRPSSLHLPGDGLAFDLRLGRRGVEQSLRIDTHGLEPGDYLLVLGHSAAVPVTHAEQPGLPAGVEGFRLQVIEESPAPDLACRADLACLADGPELA
jgi:hypothetical protein